MTFFSSLYKPLLLIGFCLFTLQCTSKSVDDKFRVPLPGEGTMTLPPSLFTPRTVAQLLTFRRDGVDYVFQAILKQSHSKGLQVVGLDALGIPVFGFRYDGRGISVQQLPPGLGKQFVEIVLRDLAFVFSAPATIRANLPKSMIFSVTPRHRFLQMHGQRILAIKFSVDNPWGGRIEYENFQENYQIEIQNLGGPIQ